MSLTACLVENLTFIEMKLTHSPQLPMCVSLYSLYDHSFLMNMFRCIGSSFPSLVLLHWESVTTVTDGERFPRVTLRKTSIRTHSFQQFRIARLRVPEVFASLKSFTVWWLKRRRSLWPTGPNWLHGSWLLPGCCLVASVSSGSPPVFLEAARLATVSYCDQEGADLLRNPEADAFDWNLAGRTCEMCDFEISVAQLPSQECFVFCIPLSFFFLVQILLI